MRAVTSTSWPEGVIHDCSGTPVRVTIPSYGLVQSTQLAPSWLVIVRTSASRLPLGAPRG